MKFTFDPSKEILLNSDLNNKYNLFPLKFPDIMALAKTGMSAHWVAEEIKYNDDIIDWEEKLNNDERFFLKNILAFFSISDGIVNENLAINFYNEIKVPEAKYLYANQIQMEAIHCVGRMTKILTDKGYYNIEDLVGQFVNVWNGYEYSNVQVKQTGEAAKLFRVALNNGMYLDCTSEHKWYDINNNIILTKNLIDNQTELKYDYTFPVTSDKKSTYKSELDFYTIGFTCNDSFIKDQTELYSRIPLNLKESEKRDFLKGLLDYHGEFIYSECDKFLHDLQLMLTTLNIKSVITSDTVTFKQYLKITYTNFDIKVISVKQLPGLHKTFCFNEPKRHLGIFNGILTGQSETYSLLIDTYIKDINEKDKLNNALDNSIIIKKKADWALKWLDNSNIFPERLIAFIFVEGIFFSGAFCSIFWLKNRKLMPALVKANKFISKDEKFHCDAGILFYSKLVQRLPEETVHAIFKEAIEIEQEFITESIPVSLLGMNSKKMIEYIKYVGDNLLVRLGYTKVYNAKNPFPWMDTSALESKNNMFEHVGSEYAKANVGNDTKENEIDFDLDL